MTAIFDAHFHVIDPSFPLVPNDGYLPDPFGVDEYVAATAPLGVDGGAVVSGSFQAFDQTYLRDALDRLGPGYVGVTQLPDTVGDAEIAELDEAGVRAIRFNLRRGGSATADALVDLGRRVNQLVGWHVELYVDAASLPDLDDRLRQLPVAVIDHLGLSRAGLPHLLRHVARGGFVKASGFGRVDLDVADALGRLVAANPAAVVFGTDLPSTRAPRPFRPTDVDLVRDALDAADAERVLATNGRALYRVDGER